MLQLTKKELIALVAHMARVNDRPQIYGLGIYSGAVHATDGIRLVRYDNPIGLDSMTRQIVPRQALEKALKVMSAKDVLFVDTFAHELLIAEEEPIGYEPFIGQHYPDADHLFALAAERVERGKPAPVGVFSFRLVADFRKIAQAAGTDLEALSVQITSSDFGDYMIVRTRDDKWTALLAGMRGF